MSERHMTSRDVTKRRHLGKGTLKYSTLEVRERSGIFIYSVIGWRLPHLL